MSSAILNYTPTLNYIGAVDITTSEFGSTMYSVLYDNQIVTLGNVLMFEYKLIKENISVPSPATVTLGFISIENAVNSGISNQWTIAIPALNDQYDPDTSVKFAVRVYVGLFGGAAEVGVTQWSNTLDVHNPPSQPAIFNAYYNNPENKDLFVFLEPDQQIDYNVVNFVAAFYYQDASNNTVWDVSLPIQAQLVTVPGDYNGKYLVYVQDFGTVSSVQGQKVVYVAVYAVYPFQDGSGNNFYSVSHVSTTYGAQLATNYSAPTVTSVGYSVYNDRSQNMTVNWNAPENSGVPGYAVAKYILNKSTDNINWTLVNDNISNAQFSYVVDVSSYVCGTTMYFQVIALDIDGATTTSATTIYSQLKIFKYALAPQNLVITNTLFNPVSNLVTMDINFNTPTDNGCGVPTDFAVIVHDASGNNVTNIVTYNSAGTGSYVYNFSAIVKPTGSVEVYLITTDTNADVQGGTIYPNRNGASVSTPYIANNFVLNAVDYQVYVDPVGSQNMNLTWNNQVAGSWSLATSGYKVYYRLDISDPWETYQTTDNLNMVFDAAAEDVDDCGNTINFYVEATLTNGDVTYVANSNQQSIKIFKYALAPQNLVITNTLFNPVSNLVTMDINFDTPANNGCGRPLRFAVIVHDASGNDVTNTVTYNSAGTGSYVYNFSAVVKPTGSVEVYLITEDTNSTNDKNGASASTPYIATNFVLNPVDYQVYVDPVGSQNMNLTWNNQVAGSWSLATSGYKVYYRLDSSDPWETYQTTDNLNMVFDAAAEGVANCGNTINFYVEATLTNGPVTYVANSNQQSIKIFKYALAPQNLIITNTLFNPVSNLVTMDINFNTPADNGCGVPTDFAIVVHDASGNDVTNTVTYNSAGTGSYVYNFSAVVKPTGSVEVYLITEDTNSTNDKNGASASTPYIATNFVLNPVDYQVYVEPVGSQNMNFSWNSQVAGSWSLVNYQLYWGLNNSGPWYLIDTTTNTVSAFNASAFGCTKVYFYVKATLSNSGVTYEASSNAVSINIFKFATAPQSVQVQWASSNEENTYMDIRMNFSNPASNGCGSVVKFVVNVEDASGNVLDTQDVDYVSGQMTPYEVNFDNVMFSSSGNVVVYMITVDTNGAGNLNGAQGTAPYIADDLPIYKNVVMNGGRTQLTFDVITQTPLVKECIVATAVTNQYVWFTTDSTSGDVRVSKTVLVNNEYKYSVTIYPGLIGASTFPTPFGIGVSNTSVGIKTQSV